jgi:hypothetical protein
MTEPPVIAFEFSGFGFFETFFGSFDIFGWRYDHVVSHDFIVGPLGRHRYAVDVGDLHGFDSAEDFVHIASQFLGIIENDTDETLVVDNKDCSHGIGAFAWMD